MNLNLDKFVSRKLVLAIGGFLSLLAAKQYEAAAGVIVSAILALAHVDAKEAAAIARTVASEVEKVADEVSQPAAAQRSAASPVRLP